jgi:preprotein translocase subunit SecG
VQRPQGGGLAGAFGGAGGSGTDTVFGGRVGDALTVMTVIAFLLYLGLAIGLNLMDPAPVAPTAAATPEITSAPGDLPLSPSDGSTGLNPATTPPITPPVTPPATESNRGTLGTGPASDAPRRTVDPDPNPEDGG